MEDLIKVVVFEVDVPKEEDITNSFIYSSPFAIEVNGVKTTWKMKCNFNYEDESFVEISVKSTSILLEPLNVCYSLHLISSNKSTEISRKSYTAKFTTSEYSWGHPKFVSHKHLFDNSSDFFITDRKIRFVAKIFCVGGIPPAKISLSSERLKTLYETMEHSDLIIKASNGEEFKAHKGIICSSSQVLSRMFSSQMKENLSGILVIDDRSEVVNTLIRFIYCGDFADEFNDIEDVDIDLYSAAERYEIKELKKVCLKSIYTRLEVENLLEIAGFAKLFALTKLYSCCLLMIYVNFALVSQSDEWKQLDDKLPIFEDITQKSLKLHSKDLWTSDDF